MAQKIAETCHVKINGRSYTTQGDDLDIQIQAGKKEEVVDSFGNGYIKSSPSLSMVSGSILTTADLNPQTVVDFTDCTVQVEMNNGRVALLRNAFFSGDAKISPADGKMSVASWRRKIYLTVLVVL
jgi:tail tube protein